MYWQFHEEAEADYLNSQAEQFDNENCQRLAGMQKTDWENLKKELEFLLFLKDRNYWYEPSKVWIEFWTHCRELLDILEENINPKIVEQEKHEVQNWWEKKDENCLEIRPEDLPF